MFFNDKIYIDSKRAWLTKVLKGTMSQCQSMKKKCCYGRPNISFSEWYLGYKGIKPPFRIYKLFRFGVTTNSKRNILVLLERKYSYEENSTLVHTADSGDF